MRSFCFIVVCTINLLFTEIAGARCYFHWGSAQSNKMIMSTLENGQFGEKSMAFFRDDYLPERTYMAGAGLYLSDHFINTINYGDDLLLVCDDSNESPPMADAGSLKKMSDSDPARLSSLPPLIRYQIFQDFSSWYVMTRALQSKDGVFKFTRLQTVQGRETFQNELRKRSKDSLLITAVTISSLEDLNHKALPLLSSLVINELRRRLGDQTLKEVIEYLSLLNKFDLKFVISLFKSLGFNYDISSRADLSQLASVLTQYGGSGVGVIVAVILNEEAETESTKLLRQIFEERCLQNFTGACVTYVTMMRQNRIGVSFRLDTSLDKFLESDFESIERQLDAQVLATLTAREYLAASVSGYKEGFRLTQRLIDGMVNSQLKNRPKTQSVGSRLLALEELVSIRSAGGAQLFEQLLNYAYPIERATESISQIAAQLVSLKNGYPKIFEGHFRKLLEALTFSKEIECADFRCLQDLVRESSEEVELLIVVRNAIVRFEDGFFSSLNERERNLFLYAHAIASTEINNPSLFKQIFFTEIGASAKSQMSDDEFHGLLLKFSKAIQQPNIQKAQTCSAPFANAG